MERSRQSHRACEDGNIFTPGHNTYKAILELHQAD